MFFSLLDDIFPLDITDIILGFLPIKDIGIEKQDKNRVYRYRRTRGLLEPTIPFTHSVWTDRLLNFDIPPGVRLEASRRLHDTTLKKELLHDAFSTIRWSSHEVCKRILHSLLLDGPLAPIGAQGIRYLTMHWPTQLFPIFMELLEKDSGFSNGIDIVFAQILKNIIIYPKMKFIRDETITLIITELDNNTPMVDVLQNNRRIFIDIWDAIKEDKPLESKKLFAFMAYSNFSKL